MQNILGAKYIRYKKYNYFFILIFGFNDSFSEIIRFDRFIINN